MGSNSKLLLLGPALLGVTAMGGGQQGSERVEYTVVEAPRNVKVAKAQYRVEHQKSVTVVSIFAGEKPTGGYRVKVTGVKRVEGACVVQYQVEGPPADAMVPQVLTYPAAVVRIASACRDVKVDPALPQGEAKE